MSRQFYIERATANATTYRFLTGVGIGLSAFPFLTGFGTNSFGLVPLLANPFLRNEFGVPVQSAIRQWNWYFNKSESYFSLAGPLCSLFFWQASSRLCQLIPASIPRVAIQTPSFRPVTAARAVEQSSPPSDVDLLLRILAVFAMLPFPYTFIRRK
ncbi:uncharacterized protein FA14DRAFT_76949 [Meira miltonrushii]|uniref:Uncharacterized protein n=1 Tax=Meira miltonrushii TaxID=1280837 RepID=A0A316V579_9BASI|nr:uncharacterized protein FA14DRAFT_76949 [Meira miltonrushii]PWN32700.1 hypothetical protein FA14DRAFT_76949 [Meira miltonrushii]